METLLAIALLILLVPTGILAFSEDARRERQWVELVSAPAHRPEPAVKAFTTLRRQGVRCRLRTRRTSLLTLGAANQTHELLVHQDDASRARSLLPELASRPGEPA